MKKLSVILGLTMVAVLGLSQIGCTKTPDNNNATTSTATPEATPDKVAIEGELTKMENDWPRIIKEHDAAAVKRLEADDAVFVYPDGSLGNKDQDVKDTESGSVTADSWEVADLKVNVLSNEAAVVTGRSIIKGGKLKMPDGKALDISGEYRWVDTFARRNGQWQQVAGCTTPVKTTAPAAKPSPSPTASPTSKASPAAAPATVVKPSPAMKATPKPATSPVKTKTP